jgi:hypothetical protein
MGAHSGAQLNQKSGQEVAKVISSRKKPATLPKTDSRYWLSRLFRNRYQNGDAIALTRDWCARIARAGRRETFNLGSPNREAAARIAQKIYSSLMTRGWEETLAEYKPKAAKPAHVATVGEFLSEVNATAGFRASTFTVYAQSLRQIAAEIGDIGDQPALDEHGQPKRDRRKRLIYLSRRDHQSGGREAWAAKVEAQPLDILTPGAVQRWKLAYIEKAGVAPDAVRRATNTAGSLLRSARALFSERALKYVMEKLTLPDPLPFAGLKIPKMTGTRYVSRIDTHSLIKAAHLELAGEPFKVFCLGMLCGLRKREIDTLLWRQVDFHSGQICVEATEYFQPKSEDSFGSVDLDAELVALLRGWKVQGGGQFVIAPELTPQPHRARSNYRCTRHFKTLYAWLRKQGVADTKKLHTLRKELGAVLASEQGIFAAQSVLRHAQISTTAAYYTDKKKRITAGLGTLLKRPQVLEDSVATAQEKND